MYIYCKCYNCVAINEKKSSSTLQMVCSLAWPEIAMMWREGTLAFYHSVLVVARNTLLSREISFIINCCQCIHSQRAVLVPDNSLHEITNIRGYKVSVYVTYTEQYTDI